MEFSTWEPAYEAIRDDFGYDRAADRRGRDRLAELAGSFAVERLNWIEGADVTIVGAAPSLTRQLERLEEVEYIIAASRAGKVLAEAGIQIDLLVTDLDQSPAPVKRYTEAGTPVVVHGHGDNIQLLKTQVPTFETSQILPTTQVEPVGPVHNFGGFTDGDRGAFLADHFGASELSFVGWDFDDRTVSAEKQRKLTWAARLLVWLEHRRGAEFSILDGYRENVTLPWLD